MVMEAIDELRLPKYTGENRCIPCTMVNGAIAVMLATLAGFLVPLDLAGSTFVAITGLTVFFAIIYLRGYLVPGTPSLTKTYFPDSILRLFDKETPQVPPTDTDIEVRLSEAGIVTECEEVDDLCLTDEFRTGWRDQIAALRETDTTPEDLARVLDVSPHRLTLREHWDGDAFVAVLDDVKIGQWESHASLIADVAAANELASEYPRWSHLEVNQRSGILNALRLFIEWCPKCGGNVALEEDLVKSCCRSFQVAVVTCEECGTRLFESEIRSGAET